MTPLVGLRPTRPQREAGIRTEPPPSVAVATPTSPPAMAAAEPPLEPPGEYSIFHGLRVTPVNKLAVNPSMANSGSVDFPTATAPARNIRSGTVPLVVAGATPRRDKEPFLV